MTSWRGFVIELQTMFSPHNPIANAEHQLNHLHMKDTHHINHYMVNFNQIDPKFRDTAMALSIITSILVSPTESRTKSVASVNHVLLTRELHRSTCGCSITNLDPTHH